MGVLPRVANVDFSRLKIEAGDKVIVRYHCDLNHKERDRMRKSLSRWAGEEVSILFVDERKFNIQVEKVRILG